jgi:hypothetical protein
MLYYSMKNNINNFIDHNYNEFINLTDSEVCHIDLSEFTNDEVLYLQSIERHDYRSICVYYSHSDNKVWVENMS